MKIGASIIMLNKNLLANVSMIVLSLSFGTISLTQSFAEDIYHLGDDDRHTQLSRNPEYLDNIEEESLFPSSSVSGNRVTVINREDELIYEFVAPRYTYGGISNTDNVTSNSVVVAKLTGGQHMIAYGGRAFGANNIAEGNVVTLEQGSIIAEAYGGSSRAGSINNTVNAVEGGVEEKLFGGHSEYGVVEGNNVNLSHAKIEGVVYGGYSEQGNVLGNTITVKELSGSSNTDGFISVSFIEEAMVGGYSQDGLVDGNKVVVRAELQSGGTSSAWWQGNANIYGGWSENGDATNNIVDIESPGKFNGYTVFGGNSDNGNAYGNEVRINGSEDIYYDIIGGQAGGNASNNKVTIDAVEHLYNQILGGNSVDKGVADNNTVLIKDVTEANAITGGMSDVSASGNRVEIINSHVLYTVYGGDVYDGIAKNNFVSVSGNSLVGDMVVGGNVNEGSSLNNEVIIGGTSKTGSEVYGGLARYGNAIGNKVTFTDNAVAEDRVVGGQSYDSDANDNMVSISANNIIESDVYGGISRTGNATGNIVTLHGQPTVDGYGAATSTNKLVEIGGAVYGGYDDNPNSLVNTGSDPNHDLFTGNTLNLVQFRGKVYGLGNFENYNWTLPKDAVNNDVLVKISGTNAVSLLNTKHTFAMINDSNRLNVGDRIVLIDYVTDAPTLSHLEVKQGNFLIYDMRAEGITSTETGHNEFVLTVLQSEKPSVKPDDDENNNNNNSNDDNTPDNDDDDQNHVVDDGNTSDNDKDHVTSEPTIPTEPDKVLAGRLNPQTKAFSEGRAAALGFVTQGADLITEAGIRAARASVAEGASNVGQINLMPFMAMNGGSSRYKTGSHVDVDGFNMVVGLATGFSLLDQHPVTIGAFFEYGRGTYNTYNSFATYSSVHGDGDTHYTGGGVLGRIEFAGTGLGRVKKLNADQADGLYAEASFRAGRIYSDFDTNDILGDRGESSSYDSGANYYGLHGGVGYVFNFDERNSLDVYGRYLWTRIDGETVNVGRDRLRFEDANSSRIRIGARYTTVYNEQLKPYIGVAYEHEFDGGIAAHAYDLKLKKPSLEGDTGIFEAGVTLKPLSTIDALSIDISGQGFVGQRQGGGGGLKVKYQF